MLEISHKGKCSQFFFTSTEKTLLSGAVQVEIHFNLFVIECME